MDTGRSDTDYVCFDHPPAATGLKLDLVVKDGGVANTECRRPVGPVSFTHG